MQTLSSLIKRITDRPVLAGSAPRSSNPKAALKIRVQCQRLVCASPVELELPANSGHSTLLEDDELSVSTNLIATRVGRWNQFEDRRHWPVKLTFYAKRASFRPLPWPTFVCPACGGEMRIIAFINHAMAVREILAYLGEPTSAPRLAPARGPPLWERADAGQGELDPQAQPAPDYECDQRIAW
jgi:hypothetical protein